jgi:hypothetical protein
MKTTIAVPAGFVPYLRKGLFIEWGYANEQLASLSLQSEGEAPERSYSSLLHTFFTILTLLFEIGSKGGDTQGDVIVNLAIGGPHIVNGLRQEHLALEDHLTEMPKTTPKAICDAACARVADFDEFIKKVEVQVRRLSRQSLMPSTVNDTTRSSPRGRSSSRVRPPRH